MSSPAPSTSISLVTTSPSHMSAPSVPANDKRTTILAIVLGVLGAITIAIILIWTFRMKRRRSVEGTDADDDLSPLHGKRITSTHPASRITPFGSEAPRFQHTPGSGMRVAQRGPDGSWRFTEPRTPLTPGSLSNLDVTPLSVSPYASPISPSLSIPARSLDWKKSQENRLRYPHDYDVEVNPPPAYRQEYVGYIDHGKI